MRKFILLLFFVGPNLQSFAQGDCSTAVEAVLGTNNVPPTGESSYYFEYTMQSNSKLVITSSSDRYVFVEANGCESPLSVGFGYNNATVTSSGIGDVVHIYWGNILGGDFNWVLEEVDFEEGDFCYNARQAEIGLNQFPSTVNSEYWYSYTMQSDAKLILSSSNVSGSISAWNGSCEFLNLLVSANNNMSISSLEVGETVYIMFRNCGSDFEWELTEVPLEEGDICTLPTFATLGLNHIPEGSRDELWFSHTMQSTSKLRLTVPSGVVNAYKGLCENLAHISSNLYGGITEMNILGLSVGDVVYIKWSNEHGNIDWVLEEVPFEEGESCGNPQEAIQGVNSTEDRGEGSSGNLYWYSYTMETDGKLVIKSDIYFPIEVYSGDCENVIVEESGTGSLQVFDLIPGQEVFIKWLFFNDSFEWELSEQPVEPGDKCSEPATAFSGTNVLPETFGEFWYYYTSTSYRNVQISTTAPAAVVAYTGGCSAPIEIGVGWQNLTLEDINVGESILLKWVPNGGDFEWELEELAFEEGDKCDLPRQAIVGDNFIPATLNEEYWYVYEMQNDGKLKVTSDDLTVVSIKVGECENFNDSWGNIGNAITPNSEQGDVFYIKWGGNGNGLGNNGSGGGNFTWQLEELPIEEGDLCSLPLQAVEGLNHLPSTSNEKFYYSYTLQSDNKLLITSSTSQRIDAYLNSCDFENSISSSSNGNLALNTLSAGDQVIIQWSANGGDFDWNLAETPFESGDKCDSPASASLGTNALPETFNHEYWYNYTMQSDSKLVISSSSGADMRMYKNGCEILEYIGGGYESKTIYSLLEGDEILIEWWLVNRLENTSFDWELDEVPFIEGDKCEISAIASLGTNVCPSTSKDFYWYSYTFSSDAQLQLTSNSESYVLIIEDGCEDRVEAGFAYENYSSENYSAGDVIHIVWYGGGVGAGFEWNLAEVAPADDPTCISAAPAELGVNTVPLGPYWYTFTAPSSGDYVFSSVGQTFYDTFLKVYSDCQRTLIAENNDFDRLQSQLTLSLIEGESIYILWEIFSTTSFDWTLTRIKDNQEIEFDPLQSYTVGDDPFELTAMASSNLPVSYTSSNKSVATVEGSTITIVGVGQTTITASQAGNEDFAPAADVEQVITVNKANQTITFEALTKNTFGDSPFVLSATATSDLPVSYASSNEAVATIEGNLVTIIGVGQTTITASQAGNDDFAPAANLEQVLTVEKANQTITFEALTNRKFGDSPFEITATATSDLLVSYASSNESVATVEGSTVTIVGAGETTLTATQGGNENFLSAVDVQQTLVVNKEVQSITFNELTDKVFGDESFQLVVSSSAGLSVSFSSSNENVAIIEDDVLSIVGAGETAITASQAGSSNYQSAQEVERILLVEKAPQSISFEVIEDQLFEDESVNMVATSTSGLPISLEVLNGTASIDEAVITWQEPGEIVVVAKQEGDANFLEASSVEQTFRVDKITDTQDVLSHGMIELFPNPVSERLTISGITNSNVDITVFDNTGLVVKSITLINDNLVLETHDLKEGLYAVMLKWSDGIKYLRFIKI
jgi:hypothetical protein